MTQFRTTLILTLMTILFAACTARQTAVDSKSPGANTNQPAANSNISQSKASNDNASAKTAQAMTGSIEVSSTPPGSRVLLVPEDEGGASEPQPRGITPTTITGVSPGKYTVHLEKPGYRFSQTNVVVKANNTAKVKAALRKQ